MPSPDEGNHPPGRSRPVYGDDGEFLGWGMTEEEWAAQQAINAYDHRNDRARFGELQRNERDAALAAYQHAGDVAALRGQQAAGEATRSYYGQGQASDALGARRALMAGGRGLTGVAAQASQQAGGERIGAVGDVMTAESRQAQYEQALYEDWLQRKQSSHESERRQNAAYRDYMAARGAQQRQMVGSLLGAAGSGVAAGAGTAGSQQGGAPQGQQQQQLSSYNSAAPDYTSGQGQQSGTDYYSDAYNALYGTGGG